MIIVTMLALGTAGIAMEAILVNNLKQYGSASDIRIDTRLSVSGILLPVVTQTVPYRHWCASDFNFGCINEKHSMICEILTTLCSTFMDNKNDKHVKK